MGFRKKMAALIGRASRQALLKVPSNVYTNQAKDMSFKALPRGKKILAGVAGAAATGALGFGVALNMAVAAEATLHPPKYPWSHKGLLDALDHASVRRGYQVYKQVCAACHSMNYVYYRQLVNVIMDEDEAKSEAADIMVTDGPDDEGNMFERPGKLYDKFPAPYKNDE